MVLTTTGQAWRDRILAWQASGMTQKDFCAKHAINISQFWNWKSRFNQQGLTKKRQKLPARAAFVPIAIADQANCPTPRSSSAGLTLEFRGYHVRIDSDFDPAALAKVLKVLGSG